MGECFLPGSFATSWTIWAPIGSSVSRRITLKFAVFSAIMTHEQVQPASLSFAMSMWENIRKALAKANRMCGKQSRMEPCTKTSSSQTKAKVRRRDAEMSSESMLSDAIYERLLRRRSRDSEARTTIWQRRYGKPPLGWQRPRVRMGVCDVEAHQCAEHSRQICQTQSFCRDIRIVQQPLKSSASSCARRHCRRMPKAWRSRPQRSWVSRMRILTVSFHKSVGWLAASLSQDLASAWARETIPRADDPCPQAGATEYLELGSPRKWTCWRWRSIRTWRLKPGKCLRGADCLF